MSDLIKREDAIKAVAQDLMYESCIQSEYASDELSDWLEVAKVMLEEVPSADRPQGEWIEQEDCWQCSECGDEYVLEVGVKPIDARMHYCPNCGARMKGADDDIH